MEEKNEKPRKKRIGLWVTLAVVGVLLGALAGGGIAYVNHLISAPNHFSREDMPILDETEISQLEEEPSEDLIEGGDLSFAENLSSDSHVMNIMLYGSDQRPNDSGQYGNADAMVLLSIDTKNQKLKMTSFMRDLWVMVPGKREYRINTAYLLGGPRLSVETIEKNFGVKIDKYAVVDFQTFPQIIDTLGGITIDLTQAEADYLNQLRLTTEFQPGPCHMNGEVALDYARARKLKGDDFGWTQRHRTVLSTVIKQFRSANLSQISSSLEQIMPMITTDLTKEERLQMLPNAMAYMKYDIVEYRLPQDDNFRYATYYYKDTPMNVLVIEDMEKARRDLHTFIYEE